MDYCGGVRVNIFYLDEDPVIAAKMQCNKHVVKMSCETAQVLCSAFNPGEAPYLRSHYNHQHAIWARESRDNYRWLLIHGLALCKEYTERYGKIHASEKVIKWCFRNAYRIDFPKEGLTTPPYAISPDMNCRTLISEFDSLSRVEQYHLYYIMDKSHFAVWPEGKMPQWYLEGALIYHEMDIQ